MRCLEIERCRTPAIERGFPAGNADAPAVAGFQTRKTPFGHWSNEIVSIEHREIEKFLGDLHANSMEPDVFRAGAAISVAVNSTTFCRSSRSTRHCRNDNDEHHDAEHQADHRD